jgi:hypothetical protein
MSSEVDVGLRHGSEVEHLIDLRDEAHVQIEPDVAREMALSAVVRAGSEALQMIGHGRAPAKLD